MNSTNDENLLKSKQHFYVLDGLRGVAAIAVVIFHFMEWVYPDFTENFIGHGFLAVDFFFCLSGFVIAYAYDNRLPKMGLKTFFTSRLIRLHPLVVAGTVLGLIGLFTDPFADHAVNYSISSVVLIVVSSLLLIPFPVMEERAFNLFSLNAPSWSLFWEYVANILYALILIRLSRKALWLLLVIAAAALIWVSYNAGNLLGGWSGGTFLDGGVRMSYSFIAGLLVFRSGWIIKNKLGFVVLSLLLAVAFMSSGLTYPWIVELIIVMFYFPLLVALGAGSVLTDPIRKICVFMGNISYPLYMTHYVGIWFFGNYFISKTIPKEQLPWVIGLGTVLMIVFAWLVMILYDMPVRNFLKRKRSERLRRKQLELQG
ncbi:Peptidoglycan/LPS O-acetylase OafA/YrhL, contains acyltransferase and SGNH-hydrolase domains [Zhouia amylolytica]|uniref:Peptidoglycan/LPS O-acetylase OafA/YrhL, contains acyltransferase and SGNH-hydrolase domains n=1 Tax=Zhouia amylolytica TaxID=376730 RepID=A0A1I6VTV0_9FLAO|nr:acyltransferase [Zhouia amylolytica]SFT17140.1 Peptidoglycan/LPS O-acetylase OafA/YrhL, contains acyltransferase and SGNH-hydrolase domains [Zhouia amylolytica]